MAPTGYKEIWPKFDLPEMIFRLMTRGYIGAIVLSPLFLAAFATKYYWTTSQDQQTIISAIIGYNALTIASCLTAATLATATTLMLLRGAGLIHIPFDFMGAISRLGTWVGLGTVWGAVTAALVPLIEVLAVLTDVPAGDSSQQMSALSPRLLFDLPASGAVIGYTFGLASFMVTFGHRGENVLFRRILAPSFLIAYVWIFPKIGIEPVHVLDSMIRPYRDSKVGDTITCSSTPNPESTEEILKDLAHVAQLFNDCAWPFVLDGRDLAISSTVVISIFAILSFVRDLYKSHRKFLSLNSTTT